MADSDTPEKPQGTKDNPLFNRPKGKVHRDIEQQIRRERMTSETDPERRERNIALANSLLEADPYPEDGEPNYFNNNMAVYIHANYEQYGDDFDGFEVSIGSGDKSVVRLKFGEVPLPEFFINSSGEVYEVVNDYVFIDEATKWVRREEIRKTSNELGRSMPSRFKKGELQLIDIGEQPSRDREMSEFDYERLQSIDTSIRNGTLKALGSWSLP